MRIEDDACEGSSASDAQTPMPGMRTVLLSALQRSIALREFVAAVIELGPRAFGMPAGL